jgi:hypothetical protein
MTLHQITLTYLNARQELEQAEKAKAQAEAELKQALAKAGTDFSIVNGTKVAVVSGERPSYDAQKLFALVSGELFGQVTKTEIDGKKFKSAVELGLIASDVAEAVTKVTAYQQVRVTDLASASAGEGKATKVA